MSHSNVGIRLHNNQPDYDTTHMKNAADLVWEQKWLLCATNNCLNSGEGNKGTLVTVFLLIPYRSAL